MLHKPLPLLASLLLATATATATAVAAPAAFEPVIATQLSHDSMAGVLFAAGTDADSAGVLRVLDATSSAGLARLRSRSLH